MRAEIISIGTEILMGEILDTNAQFIAQRLPAMGIDLFFMHQVGDNKQRLVDLITLARGRSDVVLCTGGLGPYRGRHHARRDRRLDRRSSHT